VSATPKAVPIAEPWSVPSSIAPASTAARRFDANGSLTNAAVKNSASFSPAGRSSTEDHADHGPGGS